VAAAVALALVVPAVAGEAMPARGAAGSAAVFELRATRIARSLSGRPVAIECADAATWRSLAAEYGFDRETTWALTPLRRDSGRGGRLAPGDRAVLSPRTCRLGARFLAAPTERGVRLCRHGSEPRWALRPSDSSGSPETLRRVRVRTAVWGECDAWGVTLTALHVLTHESMHLAGVVDEAPADCLGVQLDALVATRLGAAAPFARALAREYWRSYYPSQDRSYRSPECRNGRALDLFPGRSGWPAPETYPPRVSLRVRRFADAVSALSSETP